MRQLAKFLLTLCVFAAILLAVHTFAFAIYTVPTDITTTLRQGDRVMVNKMTHASFRQGDLMVFRQRERLVGAVVAGPGDTIRVGRYRYRIPRHCCRRCGCVDCKLYLVNTGQSHMLVHLHQVEGKASRLYHLPW